MEGKELAEFKNKILSKLLWHELQVLKLSDDGITIKRLYKLMEEPMEDFGSFWALIADMGRDFNKYIEVTYLKSSNNPRAKATIHTLPFLKRGGFVKQWEINREADNEALNLATQNQNLKDLQEKNLILSNRELKYFSIPLFASIASVIISGISLFFSIHASSKSVSPAELQTVKDEIKGVRDDFKKENDVLKDRLYKAEILIAVYEGDSSS